MGILDGKVALVTGAGHGIGRAHALELAKQGAKVVVNDLAPGDKGAKYAAEEVVQIIKDRGGEATFDTGDVSDEAAAEAMVKKGIDTWGRFDILVNNAGIVRDKTIWNMTTQEFDLVMAIHVRGSWLTMRAAAKHWREIAKTTGQPVGGRIINTTSGAGLQGNFGQTNYATAKAAIVGLSVTASLELASIGVTVNVISPGAATRLASGTFTGGERGIRDADDYAEGEWDPLSPQVSSPVVAWLASDRAAYVSGQVVRAMRENIQIVKGWTPTTTISNGGQPWDAEKLGALMEARIFGTRAPGLTIES